MASVSSVFSVSLPICHQWLWTLLYQIWFVSGMPSQWLKMHDSDNIITDCGLYSVMFYFEGDSWPVAENLEFMSFLYCNKICITMKCLMTKLQHVTLQQYMVIDANEVCLRHDFTACHYFPFCKVENWDQSNFLRS